MTVLTKLDLDYEYNNNYVEKYIRDIIKIL